MHGAERTASAAHWCIAVRQREIKSRLQFSPQFRTKSEQTFPNNENCSKVKLQYICPECEFNPVRGQHICASSKSPMLLSGLRIFFLLVRWRRGRGGGSSGLRSNFHDVWMCSLIPLINNHFPALTIRRRGYWPRPQVTDLLPQKRPDALAASWARMQTSWR